ncbi:molybdate ABC transporter permease subunit [Arachidicoccus ginsenosidivorans]|jgi:molybdate transport system permease protein|uniref:Molybdenum transport system permease n=1 Tax=Arachidicoccus ginsenosidivorans TaxID=496057 RepID=A0A5B8VMC0_9BACT|nr:molybdate ABC transporter permease subunit [Arachidicoccus ginsenosidivorans]QEC72479.1 molybdate ABC transporter permease subunit [Arachidicoccus ginsenosidivorans]
MDFNFQPLILSLELSLITTVLLLIIGIPIASFLAFKTFRGKSILEAIVSLPLVLPPSVLGFYLLVAFSPNNFFGKFLDSYFNLRLVFSFSGLVLGSLIYSLPFMIHPLQAGLQALAPNLKEASYSLGKSKKETMFKVLLPNIKPAILTGMVLTFAHTLGEFGVVLMIGGNLEGSTKVASIAIYDAVESLDFRSAHIYSLVLIIISFVILLITYGLNKRLFDNRVHL